MQTTYEFINSITEKLNELESYEHQLNVIRHLGTLPGASETVSIAILKKAYQEIYKNKDKIEGFQNRDYWHYKRTADADDRSFHVIKDDTGNFKVFLSIKSKRIDNSKFSYDNVKLMQGKDNKLKPALEIGGKIMLFAQAISKKQYTSEEAAIEKEQTESIQQSLRQIPKLANTFDTFVKKKDGFRKVKYSPFLSSDAVNVVANEFYDDEQQVTVESNDTDNINIAKVKLEFFKKIVDQTAAMHALGIAHRDLKPENILVDTSDGRMSPHLADLDTATLFTEQSKVKYAYAGTDLYLSPEIIAVMLAHAEGSVLLDIVKSLLTHSYGCHSGLYAERLYDLLYKDWDERNAAQEVASNDNANNTNEAQEVVSNNNANNTNEREMAKLFEVTGKEDIFALGIIFYEFLTNKRIPEYIVPNDASELELSQETVKFIAGNELLRKMLDSNPNTRCDIKEVQQILETMLLQVPHQYIEHSSNSSAISSPTYIDSLLEDLTAENFKLRIQEYVESIRYDLNDDESDPNTVWINQQVTTLANKVNELILEINNITHANEEIQKLKVEIIQLDRLFKNSQDRNLSFMKRFTRLKRPAM